MLNGFNILTPTYRLASTSWPHGSAHVTLARPKIGEAFYFVQLELHYDCLKMYEFCCALLM